MAKFFIKHITKYSYSDTVIDGATLTRLHPINDDYQKVVSHLMSVTNNPVIETFIDFYNNRVGTFMVTEPHEVLNIVSEIEVITTERLFPDDNVDATTQWKELKTAKNNPDFIDFLKHSPFSGSEAILNLMLSKNSASELPYKLVLQTLRICLRKF